MKTTRRSMLVLGVIWLAFADQAAAEMPRFKSYQIGDVGRSMGQTSLVDIDRDGDLDVFSGGGPLSETTHRCFVWENRDGKGGQWTEHMVLEGKRCHEAKAADVDADGDIDICFKPWRGSLHVYLRNMLVEDEE